MNFPKILSLANEMHEFNIKVLQKAIKFIVGASDFTFGKVSLGKFLPRPASGFKTLDERLTLVTKSLIRTSTHMKILSPKIWIFTSSCVLPFLVTTKKRCHT